MCKVADVPEVGLISQHKPVYQVAARAETGTPNLHRAKIAQQQSADGRMATEAARLKRKNSREERKIDLTLAGLLAEGIWKHQRRWLPDVH